MASGRLHLTLAIFDVASGGGIVASAASATWHSSLPIASSPPAPPYNEPFIEKTPETNSPHNLLPTHIYIIYLLAGDCGVSFCQIHLCYAAELHRATLCDVIPLRPILVIRIVFRKVDSMAKISTLQFSLWGEWGGVG